MSHIPSLPETIQHNPEHEKLKRLVSIGVTVGGLTLIGFGINALVQGHLMAGAIESGFGLMIAVPAPKINEQH